MTSSCFKKKAAIVLFCGMGFFLVCLPGTFAATPAATTKTATTPVINPGTNPNCWKKEDCEAKKDGVQQGRFDGSPDTQKECAGFGYCYPMPAKVNLSVSIVQGKRTIVQDIGGYINQMYGYLLTFSVTLAIVLVMWGGLGYVLASGSGNVKDAQARIKNALIGLVLLMCAWLILFTINPQLIQLDIPNVKKIRPVAILLGGVDCQILRERGYTIDIPQGTTGQCGDKASKVLKDKNGVAPEKETFCRWTQCRGTGPVGFQKMCVQKQDGGDVCVSCEEISIINKYNLTPSPSFCNSLTPENSATQNNVLKCDYSQNWGCTLLTIQCSGDSAVTSCKGYDSQSVYYDSYYKFDFDEYKGGAGNDKALFKQYCGQNPSPCGAQVKDQPCAFYDGVFNDDCLSASDSAFQ